jgi:hypothetical protein
MTDNDKEERMLILNKDEWDGLLSSIVQLNRRRKAIKVTQSWFDLPLAPKPQQHTDDEYERMVERYHEAVLESNLKIGRLEARIKELEADLNAIVQLYSKLGPFGKKLASSKREGDK